MRLSNKWSIEGGQGDYILVERRDGKNPKTGEPTTSEHKTYHPSLDHCAKKIAKAIGIKAMEVEQVALVKARLDEIEDEILELINGLSNHH